MGKVWVKTKFDYGMKMEIPHNHNIAQAMYGFRELGAEIIPYHEISEIYDKVTKDDIVIDYIDQCNTIFHKFGVHPSLPDYPDCLQLFLGRKIWTDYMDNFASDEKKWSAGYFVKPKRDKAFTGHVISSIKDLVGCGNHSENYEILVSESVDVKAEWRGFYYYDKMIDLRPYGRCETDHIKYGYDYQTIEKTLNAFSTWKERPAACSIDIAVIRQNGLYKTILMEVNDAYALGCYGLDPLLYAKFISARWSQLLNRSDEFHFI